MLLPLFMVACNGVLEDEGYVRHEQTPLQTIAVGFENETRTYVDNGLNLCWHEGDLVSVFCGSTLNNKYQFDGKSGDKGGELTAVESVANGGLSTGNKLDKVFAIYPYDVAARISESGVISASLPAVQSYAKESFGKDANTMVAVSQNLDNPYLGFKNLCGYLQVKLYGEATVQSIELKGNNGEKIAGAATITSDYGSMPQVVMNSDATDSITLDCGSGVALSSTPTEFWFVVPPTTFSKGLTIKATATDGKVFEQTTLKSVSIERNTIQPMAECEFAVEGYDIEFNATKLSVSYTRGSLNNYYIEVSNKEWSSSGWGVDGGTYYTFDLYSSKTSNNVVPKGTYTLSTSEKANTLLQDYSYTYAWNGGPEYMLGYEEATVVVTDEGIDAVLLLSDGTTHHVIYEGKPSF